LQFEPDALLFFSDVTAELDAARRAGLETVFVHRPGNPPAPEHGYPTVTNFDAIGV
jgi:enolase-phosphatase E1